MSLITLAVQGSFFSSISPKTVIIIIAAIFMFVLVNLFCFGYIGSKIAFLNVFKRTKPTKWSRVPKILNEQHGRMYEIGYAWHDKYEEYKTNVHIVNDGLNLYGEYFDFGNKKAVIIVAGRTDSLKYSYFFAEPYRESGYNVLVIDTRAHGESDGEVITLGHKESEDTIAWAKMIHDEYGIEKIILHGICIGSACSLYAMISDACPEYIDGMVADGMFANFGDSFKNHMIEFKIPTVLIYRIFTFMYKLKTGYSITTGPLEVIDQMHKPLLMLHSKEDNYSTPYYAEKLFEKCASKSKEIVWFPHGRHSMLRITDTEKYDAAVKSFIKRNFD